MTQNLDVLRHKLIEDDLENLSPDDIDDIVGTFWEEFKPMAVRYLERKWNDGNDVYMEACERGYTRWKEPETW